MRVAVLNDNKVLVGSRNVAKPKPTDIDCGDLPTDGKYFHDGDRFVPVGFGQGKPTRPTVSKDRAMFLFMRATINGKPVPQECRDWLTWFEKFGGNK
jgi:hypothetical protein